MVQLNKEQCVQTGEIFRSLHVRPSFYQRAFISFSATVEIKLRAYLFAVAICHQTHTLYHPLEHLYGWDYLEKMFHFVAIHQPSFLDPLEISTLPRKSIIEKLQELFSYDGNSNHCSLDRLEERARIYADIAHTLRKKYQGRVALLLLKSQGYLLHEGDGLYELLGQFDAYKDPYKKKSTIFIKLAQDARLLTVKDPEHFIPPMDYHMQRVLLRMGCVEVDQTTAQKLRGRESMDADSEIREACIQAVMIIAQESGQPIESMNDYLWPLGRSCCNNTTLCHDRHCMKDPCTFFQVVNIQDHRQCPFLSICKGYQDASYRSLWQPEIQTQYY